MIPKMLNLSKILMGRGCIDTGHKPDPMPSFFKAYFKVKNPKFEPFFRASEVLEGLRSGK